jgi:hypothetical protein
LLDLTYVILSYTAMDLFVYNGAVFLILTEVNGNRQIKTGEHLLFVTTQMRRWHVIEFALLSSGLRVRLIW